MTHTTLNVVDVKSNWERRREGWGEMEFSLTFKIIPRLLYRLKSSDWLSHNSLPPCHPSSFLTCLSQQLKCYSRQNCSCRFLQMNDWKLELVPASSTFTFSTLAPSFPEMEGDPQGIMFASSIFWWSGAISVILRCVLSVRVCSLLRRTPVTGFVPNPRRLHLRSFHSSVKALFPNKIKCWVSGGHTVLEDSILSTADIINSYFMWVDNIKTHVRKPQKLRNNEFNRKQSTGFKFQVS